MLCIVFLVASGAGRNGAGTSCFPATRRWHLKGAASSSRRLRPALVQPHPDPISERSFGSLSKRRPAAQARLRERGRAQAGQEVARPQGVRGTCRGNPPGRKSGCEPGWGGWGAPGSVPGARRGDEERTARKPGGEGQGGERASGRDSLGARCFLTGRRLASNPHSRTTRTLGSLFPFYRQNRTVWQVASDQVVKLRFQLSCPSPSARCGAKDQRRKRHFPPGTSGRTSWWRKHLSEPARSRRTPSEGAEERGNAGWRNSTFNVTASSVCRGSPSPSISRTSEIQARALALLT